MNARQRHDKNKEGFIALMSAIVLSAVLIAVTVALNQSGFFARSALLDSEYKERSAALAQACANVALLKLIADPAYAGGEIVALQSDSCWIRPTKINSPIAGENTIETSAAFQEASTTLRITAHSSDFSIVSWDEVP